MVERKLDAHCSILGHIACIEFTIKVVTIDTKIGIQAL